MYQIIITFLIIALFTSCGKKKPTKEEIDKAWENVELPGPPSEEERQNAFYVSQSHFVYKGENLTLNQIEEKLKMLKEKSRVMISIDDNSNRELLLKLHKHIEDLNLNLSVGVISKRSENTKSH